MTWPSAIDPQHAAEIAAAMAYPCEEWQGRVSNGRPVFSRPYRQSVRREVWERHRGPIPAGCVVMALCNDERCIAPEHLAAVEQGEAVRRNPRSNPGRRIRSDVCEHGHDDWGHDADGNRRCMACHRARQRARRKVSA